MDHALISIGKFKKQILLQIIVSTQRKVRPMQTYSPTTIALRHRQHVCSKIRQCIHMILSTALEKACDCTWTSCKYFCNHLKVHLK